MALGSTGSGGTQKGSIFGSLAPAPAPAAAPRPAPAPAAAPRPAVDSDALAALKLKIDALEKNIVAQLKAAAPAPGAPQQYMQAPPPPPARIPEMDMLVRKFEEMDRRLSDFSQSAAMSASQLRNIEESKISARREIEDLLKAVRDQQKYSEMDRQMHEQLERAWTRAEELEKKLMEFYSSVLALETKRREDADRSSSSTTAALDALTARLASLEARLADSKPSDELRASQQEFARRAEEQSRAQAAAIDALRAEMLAGMQKLSASSQAGEVRASQEEFFARMSEEWRRRADAQEASRQEMMGGIKESSASFKDVFENYVRKEIEIIGSKVGAETEALRRELAASTDESRKFLREQASFATEKTLEFERIAQANILKAEGVQDALDEAARRQAQALQDFSGRLQSEIRAMNSDLASAVKAENDARFDKFGAKYADALLSATFVENFSSSLAEIVGKLEGYEKALAGFLKEVDPLQLEKAGGVSGDVVRRQFGTMASTLKTLQAEGSRLREIKAGMEEKFRDIFKER
ncbi:MAG TPA: hypothetical protein DCZ92_14255 [Elusimicrobia bacterium]|nr:MAG: hypothetical protein A2016_08845 [Elusimicrobia bacterium GWF2_62_30]HBA61945.1 hypothetical protein [Elusimicrobiota bacterium]